VGEGHVEAELQVPGLSGGLGEEQSALEGGHDGGCEVGGLPGAGHRHHRVRGARPRAAVGQLDGAARWHWPPSAFAAVPAGNVEANLALVEALRTIADARGVTVGQLAIAWVLAQGQQRGDIVAVVGARTPQRLAETLPGAELTLTADDLAAIERAVPVTGVAGERYPAPQLAHLDGER